jgi:hypothetical protein
VSNPEINPTSAEQFRERAERLGVVAVDDAHMETLQRIVAENDVVMAAVVASALVPSEDPSDFLRLMRSWRERHTN